MRKSLLSVLSLIIILSMSTIVVAQERIITGTVKDDEGNPLAGVNILIKNRVAGTISDINGDFKLRIQNVDDNTLVFSMVGYKSKEYELTSGVTSVDISLEESVIVGDEVVVSASRVEESIMESPVTVEKLSIRDIRETPSVSFYDAIGNIKGVDLSAQSLTFKSINARGFGSNGNERFVQLIDGVDNQAPGLNFPVGNIVGISELDLESVELIPGASSALYGPNAINGILLMNSKSPFEYQGLSIAVKMGLNHVDRRDDDVSPFIEYSMRFAKSFNDKVAFKVNASILRANDFVGVNERDQSDNRVETSNATRASRTYDGVNVYGDPVLNIGSTVQGVIDDPNSDPVQRQQLEATRQLYPNGESGNFSPRGWAERDFVDNTTQSLKFNTAIHYRLNDNVEWINQFNIGSGNSVYTGNDRYVLDGFYIWTAKTELRGADFFVRAYTTQENSGDTYAANGLASLINRETYIPAYLRGFGAARSGLAPGFPSSQSVETSHQIARQAGEAAYVEAGSEAFNTLYDSLRALPIGQGGARFLDKTGLYQFEGMYDISKYVNNALDIIVGGNVRHYDLNSEGTLFALDNEQNEYDIVEWGGYAQLKKKVLNEQLGLTASVRYDKNEYFEGQFSPKFSAVFNLNKTHFIRVSAQRGFRMPTTQDQFIDLDITSRRLVGSNEDLIERYRFRENTVYNSLSVDRARAFYNETNDLNGARQLLQAEEIREFDTEKINTLEIGYKSTVRNKLFIDAYYFYSVYQDFILSMDFTQAVPNGITNPGPADPNSDNAKDGIITGNAITQRFGFDFNVQENVRVHGAAIGADYQLPKGYMLGGNISYNELLNEEELVTEGFQRNFNTPRIRYNLKLSNREFVKNTGFNLAYRWQDAFIWQSAIGNGVIPSFGTLDAQFSRKVKKMKSIIKIGGVNVLNNRYTTSFANPSLGAMYYVGITFDEFLN